MTIHSDVDLTGGNPATPRGDVSTAEAQGEVRGRSPRQIAWERFRHDKVAMASAVVILLLILMAIFAPVITLLNGHPPDAAYPDTLNQSLGGLPNGRFGGISTKFLLGVEPGTGRDLLSRVAYGARISLLISIAATLITVVLGTVLGVCAGFFGGWVDAVIGRGMDILFAFPALIFMIALVAVTPGFPRLLLLILILSFFGWPYLGRIVRGQTISLREREYVESARAIGGKRRYIITHELLPNLVAPIIVFATMTIPGYITVEAGLSFLGLGVQPPTPSWGQMISGAVTWYATDPMYFAVPGFFLVLTVLAFNLLGDGLRDALDPRGR